MTNDSLLSPPTHAAGQCEANYKAASLQPKGFQCHCLQTLQGQYESARQHLTSSHQEVQTCKAQLHQAQQSLLDLQGKMLEAEQPLQQMVKRAQVAEAALCKSRYGAGPLPCCMSTRKPAPTPANTTQPVQGKLEVPGRPAGAGWLAQCPCAAGRDFWHAAAGTELPTAPLQEL